MSAYPTKAALAASVLALATFATPAAAQVTGRTQGGVTKE